MNILRDIHRFWGDRAFPLEGLLRKSYHLRWGYYDVLLLASFLDNHRGVNILDMDNWDNAIVLDACRYDTFKKINWLPGELTCIQSPGSATMEWIQRCVTRSYDDTVIYAANPHFIKKSKTTGTIAPRIQQFIKHGNRFHDVIHAWDIGHDDELDVCPPWTMNMIVKRRLKKYPGKRNIIWYNQPHRPFIGENYMGKDLWREVSTGKREVDELRDAYEENLHIALTYVEKLLPSLPGRTIITSDHGNCFGELGIYEHPQRVHIPPLIDVPLIFLEP